MNRKSTLAMLFLVAAVILLVFGYSIGQKQATEHCQKLRFGALILGINSLDDLKKGNVEDVEKRIRLQAYLDAMSLLKDKHWQKDQLLLDFAHELWETGKKSPHYNKSQTEKHFDLFMTNQSIKEKES